MARILPDATTGHSTAAVTHDGTSRGRLVGMHVPICSNGGLLHDYHMTLALAMGADFVMMGGYFTRFDQAPGRKVRPRSEPRCPYRRFPARRGTHGLGGVTRRQISSSRPRSSGVPIRTIF